MAIIRTATTIAIFNIFCCFMFIVFKFLLFYEYLELHKRQYELHWIFTTKPAAFYGEKFSLIIFKYFNFDIFLTTVDYGIMMIAEMLGYFVGIYANAMLVLVINTARYQVSVFSWNFYFKTSFFFSFKNTYCFFKIYYIASLYLSIITIIVGIQLEFLPYFVFSFVNFLFLYAVTIIHKRLLKEREETAIFHALS